MRPPKCRNSRRLYCAAPSNVFSDGVRLQMATVTGNVAAGYVAELRVEMAD